MDTDFEPPEPLDDLPERIDVDALLAQCGPRYAGFDPWHIGRSLSMSDQKIRMGIALLNGMDATAAARQAGWTGEGAALRSAASKARNSKAMRKFLEVAESFKAAPSEEPLTDDKKLAILAEISKTDASRQVRIWAIKAHSQMQADMRTAARNAEMEGDPERTLDEIAELSPALAITLAKKYEMEWQPSVEQQLMAAREICAAQAVLASMQSAEQAQ